MPLLLCLAPAMAESEARKAAAVAQAQEVARQTGDRVQAVRTRRRSLESSAAVTANMREAQLELGT